MPGVYNCIKDGLIALLKAAYPQRDVFTEEIAKTQGVGLAQGLDIEAILNLEVQTEPEPDEKTDVEDYFFLDVVTVNVQTLDADFAECTFLIDITAHIKSESNAAYNALGEEIDALIRPVFRFGDRSITVNRASWRVVDRLLHYTFTISFIPDIAVDDDGQLMDELDVAIHTNK